VHDVVPALGIEVELPPEKLDLFVKREGEGSGNGHYSARKEEGEGRKECFSLTSPPSPLFATPSSLPG
jgi:hypothetical protein